MARVLVTGATGFIGRHLCRLLPVAGHVVRAAVRAQPSSPLSVPDQVFVGDLGPTTDWGAALADVDTVIHLAGRVHEVRDRASSSHLHEEINSVGTRRLAAAAARSGVRRFIYLSTVKVNGEETSGRAYTAADEPRPTDAYAVSKWAAERSLRELTADARMDAVIVRPPLVYGPGVRANFLRLLHWIERGWPLPLGAIRNERSLVSIWNLCDLLTNLVENPHAGGQTWMVSDAENLSTPELVRRIGAAMKRTVTLLPVPASILAAGATLLGRRSEAARLCGSLVVDISATRASLGWTPPVTVDEALSRTTDWYLREVAARGSGR
jgi:UDP-N-acetyl-alpha-D-quinovosamine dehydrogenase